MILVFDIGNTTSVLGLFNKTTLVHTAFLPSSQLTPSTLTTFINKFLRRNNTSFSSIHGVAIASVVPTITTLLVQLFQKEHNLQPLIIHGLLDCGIIIRYDNPRKLGADRLCNIVAAADSYPGTTIVIDYGTATKFEVVSGKDGYYGGIIAPGLGLMTKSLSANTAQLPNVKTKFPKSILGNNTQACLQSGVMNGMISLTEGMVKKIRREYSSMKTIVVTGGFAPLLLPHLTFSKKIVHEPNLVLEGARIIYERVRGK